MTLDDVRWYGEPNGLLYYEEKEELLRLCDEAMSTHPTGSWAKFIELGCYIYGTTFAMAKRYPQARIYGIDLWGWDHINHSQFPEAMECALKNLLESRITNIYPLRLDTTIAAGAFYDNSVDIVFIDSQHTYDQSKSEINAWWSKLRVGGIMCGHDYSSEFQGVIDAADEIFGKENVNNKVRSIWSIKKS